MSALQRRQRLLVCTNPVSFSLFAELEVSVDAATVEVTEWTCFLCDMARCSSKICQRKFQDWRFLLSRFFDGYPEDIHFQQ